MKTYKLLFIFIFSTVTLTAQKATIKGTIKNTDKTPIEGVSITYANYGTTSNNNGVDNIFDKKNTTSWKSEKGAASDEGIMIHFQNKIFIQKIFYLLKPHFF